jgi:hypothetical protein
MLKALMLRQSMMEDARTDFKPSTDDWKTVDLKFKSYLDDAVEFVNSPRWEFFERGPPEIVRIYVVTEWNGTCLL